MTAYMTFVEEKKKRKEIVKNGWAIKYEKKSRADALNRFG